MSMFSLDACMRACMHACMHAYIHTYIHTYMFVCPYVCIYIYAYILLYVRWAANISCHVRLQTVHVSLLLGGMAHLCMLHMSKSLNSLREGGCIGD